MRLDMNCIPCNINQAIRIADLLDLAPEVRENMMREILAHLGGSDYGLSNPEIFAHGRSSPVMPAIPIPTVKP